MQRLPSFPHAASAASAASTSRPRANPSRGIFVLPLTAGAPQQLSVAVAAAVRRSDGRPVRHCRRLPQPPQQPFPPSIGSIVVSWFPRVHTVNQWTTRLPSYRSNPAWVQPVLDRYNGSTWVRCGPVPTSAEPTNRATEAITLSSELQIERSTYEF